MNASKNRVFNLAVLIILFITAKNTYCEIKTNAPRKAFIDELNCYSFARVKSPDLILDANRKSLKPSNISQKDREYIESFLQYDRLGKRASSDAVFFALKATNLASQISGVKINIIKLYEPTDDDVRIALKGISRSSLVEFQKEMGAVYWYVQVCGIDVLGKKFFWVSFTPDPRDESNFCHDHACDGGWMFWRAIYDPISKECYHYQEHGR